MPDEGVHPAERIFGVAEKFHAIAD